MSIAIRFHAPDTGSRVASSVGRRFRAAMKSMQYAQMVSALNRVPDTYINEAGLRRCDIPGHARRLVYGDE
jgi:uncharacterized protein YjiS (DUF1127 family)